MLAEVMADKQTMAEAVPQIIEVMQRYERAAMALAAGKAVSIMADQLDVPVADWLQELKNYLIVDHTDPGDEISYKVYATLSKGRVIARAKKAYS